MLILCCHASFDLSGLLILLCGVLRHAGVNSVAQEDSCPDYMLKAEECLKAEEERVANYLHVDTKPKLLKEVETEILEHYESELLEKDNSGAASLMRDDKVGAAFH